MSKKQKPNNQSLKPHGPNAAPWTWLDFARLGDEWFALYAYSHKWLASVTLFALGHAVELYLKAGIAKRTGRIEDAVAFGHNLNGMWQELKSIDSAFMRGYSIRSNVFDVAYAADETDIQALLSEAGWKHYLIHRELYLVVKFVADLKYLGTPLKKQMYQHLPYIRRNPYWINFFRKMRDWLWKGEPVQIDRASELVWFGDVDGPAAEFLRGLGLRQWGPPVTLFSFSADAGEQSVSASS